jgi:hypothetical protein
MSTAAMALAAGCPSSPSGGPTGSGDGGAGGCPSGPHPSFLLDVEAESGSVPPDTEILVKWSAGDEPPFVLNDKSTWKTLDAANIVCSVDPKGPPPTTLAKLACELWTSGATEIVVKAKGYVTSDETHAPMDSDICKTPLSAVVTVVLMAEPDAGT